MDTQKNSKAISIKAIMKDPKLSGILFDAWDAPVGSTKRKRAKSILKSINNSSNNFVYKMDGQGGSSDPYGLNNPLFTNPFANQSNLTLSGVLNNNNASSNIYSPSQSNLTTGYNSSTGSLSQPTDLLSPLKKTVFVNTIDTLMPDKNTYSPNLMTLGTDSVPGSMYGPKVWQDFKASHPGIDWSYHVAIDGTKYPDANSQNAAFENIQSVGGTLYGKPKEGTTIGNYGYDAFINNPSLGMEFNPSSGTTDGTANLSNTLTGGDTGSSLFGTDTGESAAQELAFNTYKDNLTDALNDQMNIYQKMSDLLQKDDGIESIDKWYNSLDSSAKSYMSSVYDAVKAGYGPDYFAAKAINDEKALGELGLPKDVTNLLPLYYLSSAGELNELRDTIKKSYQLDTQLQRLTDLQNKGLTIDQDLSAYIRGKDEYLGEIDEMMTKFKKDMAYKDTSNPKVAGRMNNYLNYLTILYGRQNQRYIDFLKMGIDYHNATIAQATNLYKVSLDQAEYEYGQMASIIEGKYKMADKIYGEVKTMLGGLYTNVEARAAAIDQKEAYELQKLESLANIQGAMIENMTAMYEIENGTLSGIDPMTVAAYSEMVKNDVTTLSGIPDEKMRNAVALNLYSQGYTPDDGWDKFNETAIEFAMGITKKDDIYEFPSYNPQTIMDQVSSVNQNPEQSFSKFLEYMGVNLNSFSSSGDFSKEVENFMTWYRETESGIAALAAGGALSPEVIEKEFSPTGAYPTETEQLAILSLMMRLKEYDESGKFLRYKTKFQQSLGQGILTFFGQEGKLDEVESAIKAMMGMGFGGTISPNEDTIQKFENKFGSQFKDYTPFIFNYFNANGETGVRLWLEKSDEDKLYELKNGIVAQIIARDAPGI
jgi:hypothetical protein